MEGEITLFYENGTAVSKKIGKFVNVTDRFLMIEVSGKFITIPVSRIVRIEEDGKTVMS